MKKVLFVLALAAVSGPAWCALGGLAQAAQTNVPGFHTAGSSSGRVPAAAAKQTIALIYSPLYALASISVGVAGLTNPGTGIFCIAPKKAISATVAPTVTVEWGASLGNNLEAFYEQAAADCPTGNIEVRTFDFSSGTATAAQNVAFIVTVP